MLNAFLIILPIILFVLAVYLIALFPGFKKGISFQPFEECYIAHRGLFKNDGDCPENSIAAFSRAVALDYGIELDVQLTKDKALVVFHDDSLARMCGIEKNIQDCTYEELQHLCLLKSGEKIPLLEEVLSVVGGKVPLIVEIKNSPNWHEATVATAKLLDRYTGCYCIESFSPLVVEWYKKNRPNVIRGQLSTNYFRDEPQMGFLSKFVLTNLLLNVRAKPDFIAYNHIHKNQLSYKLLRLLYPIKNVAWTIKSQQELETAKDTFSCFIFDSFIPD